MERTLASYVRALRAAGVRASTAETLDAVAAVGRLGYDDRALLRDVLAISLAKSATEKTIHDRVFEQFFALDAVTSQTATSVADDAAPVVTGDAAVDRLIALSGVSAVGDEGSSDAGATSDAGTVALMRAALAAGVDDIRFQSQTSYYVGRILHQLGIAALETRMVGQMMARTPAAQAEARLLSDVRSALQRRVRAIVGRRHDLFGKPATDAFMADVAMKRPLSAMTPGEVSRMTEMVMRLAKRLAARHSRRRRIRENGRLDIRRTLRANAGHDFVPFTLVNTWRRRDTPRIVAICDVSGSVAPYARFLLLFLYALHSAATDVRAFAFSNRLMDVAPALERLPFDEAMQTILKHAGGGGTDYGQALGDLHSGFWTAIDRRTTVLILGDGRSNGTNPRLDLFAEMADRAKRVVWLSPEPRGRWGSGDSCLLQYEPYCTLMTHCATAVDIERAIEESLEAYG